MAPQLIDADGATVDTRKDGVTIDTKESACGMHRDFNHVQAIAGSKGSGSGRGSWGRGREGVGGWG